MKIIHAADLHIGAKVKNIDDLSLANEIKTSLENSFKELVKYAKDNEIKVIMLSGDVFDSDKVTKQDKKFFYDIIKKNSDVDFLYLKGNHDSSSLNDETNIENLKTFNDKWINYEYDDVVISGVELAKKNNSAIYTSLKLNKDKFNIVMLHGNESTTEGIQDININRLKSKNINYLALGHIHERKEKEFEEKHYLVYPGCLTSHGFDEEGEKGFYVLDINKSSIEKEFVVIKNSKFYHIDVDISKTNSELEAVDSIEDNIKFDKDGIYEIVLNGKTNYDLTKLKSRIEVSNKNKARYIKVKNKAYYAIDTTIYDLDKSLKGEFVRNVKANENFDDETKNDVIALGLKLLNGEDID